MESTKAEQTDGSVKAVISEDVCNGKDPTVDRIVDEERSFENEASDDELKPLRSGRRPGQVMMDPTFAENLQKPGLPPEKNEKHRNEDANFAESKSFTVNMPDSSAPGGCKYITINLIDPDTEPSLSRRTSVDSGEPSFPRFQNQLFDKRKPGKSNLRKHSAYSLGQDTGSRSSSRVPSRKTSTVIFHDQPQFFNLPHHHSNRSSLDMSNLASRRMSRMSIFSLQSNGRPSLQGDWDFQDGMEVTPHVSHYQNVMSALTSFRQRPTLQQLREEQVTEMGDDLSDDIDDEEDDESRKSKNKPTPKMGWIQGVLIRCLLNIFGVMLFLRLTWITGQAGIGFASVIILLSAFVTSVTTMSMAAICTNGEVKGGGAYYLISRSLGPEFGGAIGVIFSVANAVAAAMYVVGFAETVRDLMWENGAVITGDPLHEVRIIGVATSVLILCIVLIGLDFEAKAQLVLLVILLAAILNFFVGTFLPATPDEQAKGFIGYSGDLFMENFFPEFRGVSFFQVFSIFFPASTGIQAGANISGDLKDPSSAIPKGTFLAIFLTTIIYLGMVWSSGSCILRDALGLVLVNSNVTTNVSSFTTDTVNVFDQCVNATCPYGLLNDNGAVGIASAYKPLIIAGIFSATLSSALASLVSAPKVFQALGKDKLFPYINFFAKGYGETGEPKRGYFLTFVICVAMTCIGALDVIAPIISNFFLMAYALINFSCFDASFANSPGFRPAYKLYNKWVSLLGALLCLAVMFLINWWAALVTFVITIALYLYIKHKSPDVNWGSSTQAHVYKAALSSSLKLADTEEHVKNYHPNILVLSGYPRNRPALMDFVSTITQKQSLLISGHVLLGDLTMHASQIRSDAAYTWFRNRSIKAFYSNIAAPNLRIGVQTLLQTSGVGKLRPSILILGFKNDWEVDDPRIVFNYVGILHDAFDLRYGVGILRVSEGFDVHKVSDELLAESDDGDRADGAYTHYDDGDDNGEDFIKSDDENDENEDKKAKQTEKMNSFNEDQIHENNNVKDGPNGRIPGSEEPIPMKRLSFKEGEDNEAYESETQPAEDDDDTLANRRKIRKLTKGISVDDELLGNRFRRKQKGTIDVWWLFDDGGLALLLPYILSTRKQWKGCKLRVFCAGTKNGREEEDRQSMKQLLKKFRIEYSEIVVVPDLKRKPRRSTYKEFEAMINSWRLPSGDSQDEYPWMITNADLRAQKQKTYSKLRLRELLLEHSCGASLIVMLLPILRITSCPAGLYMAWLEILTKGLPPTWLLRGNQESVLTYFS